MTALRLTRSELPKLPPPLSGKRGSQLTDTNKETRLFVRDVKLLRRALLMR